MLSRPLLAGNDNDNDDDDDNNIVDLEDGEKQISSATSCTSPLCTVVTSLGTALPYLLVALLPSFVQLLLRRRRRSPSTPPVLVPKSDRSDALTYLTGVRGLASVVVFVYHWTHGSYHDSMDYAYGDSSSTSISNSTGTVSESSAHNHVLQLPLLRLLYAAEAMVALFFVLSGYVLSYRPAKQMRAGTTLSSLSPLAFRRAPRLFLPALAATLIAFLLQLVGALPPAKTLTPSVLGPTVGTLLLFLRSLVSDGVWTWDTRPGPGWSLHPHLWTVPTEWRCSMVLFAVLLVTADRSPLCRLLIEVIVALWCLAAGRWDVALFVTGAVLAELRLRREAQDTAGTGVAARKVVWVWLRAVALGIMLLLGLLLAGYPRMPPVASAPVYGPLAVLAGMDAGARRVYYAFGAVLVLGALDGLPMAQRLFSSHVALYFGRISYALYLVHGLLIRAVGQRILDAVWRATAGEGLGFGVRFALASVLFVPVVVWVADLFERGVERRLVVWARSW